MNKKSFSPRKAAYEAADIYGFSRTTRDVLIEILALAQRYKALYPSVETLAVRARCSTRSAQRALRSLEAAGIINVQAQFRRIGGSIRQVCNRYRVTKWQGFIVKEVKKSISVGELWEAYMANRSIKGISQQSLYAFARAEGESNPQWTISAWLMWWREKHPNTRFTKYAWEKALSGWIANKHNLFAY